MNIIDMHCDTIKEIYDAKKNGEVISLRDNRLNVDLQKMNRADYLLQTFALFVPLNEVDNPLESCMEMIDCYYDSMKSNSDLIMPALSYEDIINNKANGKMSGLLAVEEGGVTKNNLAYLRNFYRLGVRLITLTWNFENGIGYPNFYYDLKNGEIPDFQKPNTTDGLTAYGIEMVEEMEQLGMLIDVSHLSDAGFMDVVNHTKKPFIASHSNARSICNVCRNLTDDMIRILANRGGIAGLNFCGSFLTFSSDIKKEPKSTIEAMVRHIKHIVMVGGTDVLALGSDFDGIPQNLELKDASYMPLLADALKKEGIHEDTIDKIFYQNALRVIREIL